MSHFQRPLPDARRGGLPLVLSLVLCLCGCPLQGHGTATSGQQVPGAERPEGGQADCPEPLSPAPRLQPPMAPQAGASPAEASLSHAISLHAQGEMSAARAEAGKVLAELQRHGIDSLSLRQLIGIWALEDGDGEVAERQFEVVVGSGEASELLVEHAVRLLRESRVMAYGVDAVTLSDARDLFAQEQWQAADDVLKQLFQHGEDGDVLRDAERLRDEMRATAGELGAALLVEADQVLLGPGPYDRVSELLARVELLPTGTWNHVELERLRSWFAELGGSMLASPAVVTVPEASSFAALEDTLEKARTLVAATQYREALAQLEKLEGSALQDIARLEAASAIDTLVREERVRAARLFVAARKEKDPEVKARGLVEVRVLLQGLLADFPGSKYARRVQDNLASVERELNAARELLGLEAGTP